METIRVKAFRKGGVPRRRVGEVFDAPAGKDGKLRADYATFAKPVAPETVKGKPVKRAEAPKFEKVDGDYVPEGGKRRVTGGGEPQPDNGGGDLV
jgi:hypothetical protein